MASSRVRHGAHRRTRHLHSTVAPHPIGISQHRHPHRGRCVGDERGSGGADRRPGENSGGRRALGVGRMSEMFDIAIVGGGMVGASLAVALAGLGVRMALIEAVPHDAASQPSFDERTTALSNGSRRILETLGVWPAVSAAATPIAKIHVSDQGHFGFARIDAAEQGLRALGYVVANRALGAALWSKLGDQGDLRLYCPARVSRLIPGEQSVELGVSEASGVESSIRAQLVVAADGIESAVRSAFGVSADVRDYEQ